ncbi:hypothetical protein K7X08_024267 [Anisodus acutangulus]|uniref:Flotillin-like n=1 Tax=Anisodus acutangulus TaxID=402998 RepID=A0A9Q1MAH4_9SOLA|nr:hypothetical protein K7X08_024267 [Anisodus acutangulus]
MLSWQGRKLCGRRLSGRQRWMAIREAELQMEVEKKKAFLQTAKLKPELLSKANVEYDIKVQEENSQLYRRQKEAEAELFERQKKAEAQKASADAELYTRQHTAKGSRRSSSNWESRSHLLRIHS